MTANDEQHETNNEHHQQQQSSSLLLPNHDTTDVERKQIDRPAPVAPHSSGSGSTTANTNQSDSSSSSSSSSCLPVLTYFDLAFRALPTRLCFEMANIPYVDRRLTVDEWETKEKYDKVLYPQGFLPTLQVTAPEISERYLPLPPASGSSLPSTTTSATTSTTTQTQQQQTEEYTSATTPKMILNQPLAIAAFAAQSAGLVRTHPMEEALIDEAIQVLEELITGKHGLKSVSSSNISSSSSGSDSSATAAGEEEKSREEADRGRGSQQQLTSLSQSQSQQQEQQNVTMTMTRGITRDEWVVNCLDPLLSRLESLVTGETFFLPPVRYQDPTTTTAKKAVTKEKTTTKVAAVADDEKNEINNEPMEYPTLADLWIVAFVDFLASGLVFDIPCRDDFERFPLLMRIVYNVKHIPQVRAYYKKHRSENVVKGFLPPSPSPPTTTTAPFSPASPATSSPTLTNSSSSVVKANAAAAAVAADASVDDEKRRS